MLGFEELPRDFTVDVGVELELLKDSGSNIGPDLDLELLQDCRPWKWLVAIISGSDLKGVGFEAGIEGTGASPSSTWTTCRMEGRARGLG